jgi:hypothetical protein
MVFGGACGVVRVWCDLYDQRWRVWIQCVHSASQGLGESGMRLLVVGGLDNIPVIY